MHCQFSLAASHAYLQAQLNTDAYILLAGDDTTVFSEQTAW